MTDSITFGIVTGQHWRPWPMLVEQWRWAEETGWDSAWLFDHFFSLYDGEDGPTLDGWTALAGLACLTSRVRLGLMVTGNTHRNPAI
ncbi:MAG TPA: LLM class flavin-dependent oxidoreductase, partial [Thermomicrobiales bacterium]|nr:LLM class flavin-dependent oxidoreductase [Thermomicrobiales bacterium]